MIKKILSIKFPKIFCSENVNHVKYKDIYSRRNQQWRPQLIAVRLLRDSRMS